MKTETPELVRLFKELFLSVYKDENAWTMCSRWPQWLRVAAHVQSKLNALHKENEALRKAWTKFGRHKSRCSQLNGTSALCDCGFVETNMKF